MTTTTSTSNSLFNSAAASGSSDTVSKSASTDPTQDMFTQLLVAQIQNQDPMNPQDPTQYVNQLATLSQTEALQSLNSTTSASASVLQSLQTLALGSDVGSNVTVATNTLKLDGNKVSGAVQLNGISGDTKLVLTGTDGRQHTVDLGAGSGAQSFTLDPDALGLAPGTYTIQAQPSDGSAPTVEITARLNSMRVNSTGVVMQVANVGDVDPSAITAFNGTTGS